MEDGGFYDEEYDNSYQCNQISSSHRVKTYGGIYEGNLMEYALTGRGEVLAFFTSSKEPIRKQRGNFAKSYRNK